MLPGGIGAGEDLGEAGTSCPLPPWSRTVIQSALAPALVLGFHHRDRVASGVGTERRCIADIRLGPAPTIVAVEDGLPVGDLHDWMISLPDRLCLFLAWFAFLDDIC